MSRAGGPITAAAVRTMFEAAAPDHVPRDEDIARVARWLELKRGGKPADIAPSPLRSITDSFLKELQREAGAVGALDFAEPWVQQRLTDLRLAQLTAEALFRTPDKIGHGKQGDIYQVAVWAADAWRNVGYVPSIAGAARFVSPALKLARDEWRAEGAVAKELQRIAGFRAYLDYLAQAVGTNRTP